VDKEKRKGNISIPENLEEVLSEAQRNALSGIEYLGWEPRFLRRPLFQAPVLVLRNTNDSRIGIMDEEGRIRIQADVRQCEQASPTTAPPTKNLHYY